MRMKLRDDWVMLGRPLPCGWHPFKWEVIVGGPAVFYSNGQLVVYHSSANFVTGQVDDDRDMCLVLVRASAIAGLFDLREE